MRAYDDPAGMEETDALQFTLESYFIVLRCMMAFDWQAAYLTADTTERFLVLRLNQCTEVIKYDPMFKLSHFLSSWHCV